MDKSFSTVLELRWGGKNPRIIYDDGMNVLFYANGDRHDHWAVWQEKEGLKNFYSLDPDRYHGNLWVGETDYGLCRWTRNVAFALEKNGVNKNNLYLAIREIFDMRDDPTDEKTVYKIFEILRKYFGSLIGNENFNKKNFVFKDGNIIDQGYDFKYRYEGLRDLTHLFLTGYAFHYGNCNRYVPRNRLFNIYRSLKYKDLFYRSASHSLQNIMDDKSTIIARICFIDSAKMESEEDAIKRIRDSIIISETIVEKLVTQVNDITQEKRNEIIKRIDKEISENEKEKKDDDIVDPHGYDLKW